MIPAFRLRNIRFEFNIGFAVLVLAVCAVMLRAGFWQLDRASEKILLRQKLEAASLKPVLHIFGDLPPPETLRYRQIRISGQYRTDKQFLLDNKIRTDAAGAQVGYHVITPFVTDAGTLLVDRGWVPLGSDRGRLPEAAVDADERTILGTLDVPGQGFRLGSIDSDDGWPRVIQYVDYELLSQRLDGKVYPAIIVLAGDRADGFEANWNPLLEGPERHYSYATQWFLICGAVVLMFIWFSAKRIEP
jgi:cytochrome oxidase assembly protein ShyY1